MYPKTPLDNRELSLDLHLNTMYGRLMNKDPKLKKGSTPILILSVLSGGPNHGYAIAREIERLSADALNVGEGALYPALRTLARDGLAESTWGIQPSGPSRRTYTLTEAGHVKLAASRKSWQRFSNAVNAVLGDPSEDNLGGVPHAQSA